MFEQVVRVSEALSSGVGHRSGALIPGLWGCTDCGTAAMISSPVWGRCKDCGENLSILSPPRSTPA